MAGWAGPNNGLGNLLKQIYFDTPATPVLSAPPHTIKGRIQDGLASVLEKVGYTPRHAQSFAGKATGFVNDVTPVGSAISADDAGADFRNGDYASAAGNGLLSLLGLVPDGGVVAGKGLGALHAIIGPVFHGGRAFDQFSMKKAGTNAGNRAQAAMWFTPDPQEANRYAFMAGDANYSGTAVYPAMIDDTDFLRISPEMNTFGHRDGQQFYHSSFFDPVLKKARREGRPGVVFENVKEGPSALDQIAVLDTARVRPAFGGKR